MKIYNTYTNKKEEFVPIKDGEVTIYYCGPTVYNYIHIGNARPIVFFDTLKKYFEHKGLKVRMASNFTDLNEKILAQAKVENLKEEEVANKYINAYLNNVKWLGADDSFLKPRVTEYIDEIISFIEKMVENGSAYVKGNDVYFSVLKDEKYGVLSNRKLEEMIQGARVEVRKEKESGYDFALWKEFHEGITYKSPWGEGRPGWHTECCVMINELFNSPIDIHGGGADLIFPHHENEIAQNEMVNHNQLANYWMHNGRLNYGDEKMSKSLGNVIWLKDLTCDYRAFRLLILSFPYRNIIPYTNDLQLQFEQTFERIKNAYLKAFYTLDYHNLLDEKSVSVKSKELLDKFDQANDDDMNTPNGISIIMDAVKCINHFLRSKDTFKDAVSLLYSLKEMLSIYGLEIKEAVRMSDETRNIYSNWQKSRNEKDFEKADLYRDELIKKGIVL